tara:strand:- start:6143 stop:6646 length:504 start_codon:yes stop_codon:yes gene_type:complete
MWATRKHSGFTIVELLIVVVVIGILAAIVIVAYNGITNSANDSAVKSDLANAAKALEIYRVNEGAYPASVSQVGAMTTPIKVSTQAYQKAPLYNFAYCWGSSGSSYAIAARSSSGNDFYVSSDSGGVQSFAGWAGVINTICVTNLSQSAGGWGYRGDTATWQSWIST